MCSFAFENQVLGHSRMVWSSQHCAVSVKIDRALTTATRNDFWQVVCKRAISLCKRAQHIQKIFIYVQQGSVDQREGGRERERERDREWTRESDKEWERDRAR